MLLGKKPYSVKIKGKSCVIYMEGKNKISIDAELTYDPPGVTIFTDDMGEWDKSAGDKIISQDHRLLIIRNITEDLNANGYSVDIN